MKEDKVVRKARSVQSDKKGIRKAGRPRFNLDLSEVEKLCAIGCTHIEIAEWLEISERTLHNWLSDEERTFQVKNGDSGKIESKTLRQIMDRGYARMKISIRRQQIKLLMEGNVTMAIWLGKQVLGQKDQVKADVAVRKGKTFDELLEEYVEMGGDPIGS